MCILTRSVTHTHKHAHIQILDTHEYEAHEVYNNKHKTTIFLNIQFIGQSVLAQTL